jgi:hypothetical protein
MFELFKNNELTSNLIMVLNLYLNKYLEEIKNNVESIQNEKK